MYVCVYVCEKKAIKGGESRVCVRVCVCVCVCVCMCVWVCVWEREREDIRQ